MLEENGEWVDAQALPLDQEWVRYGGPDAAPVCSDGPHPETGDLVAGWYAIDVDSYDRAVELAAYVSSEPGPGEPVLRDGWKVLAVRAYLVRRAALARAAGSPGRVNET